MFIIGESVDTAEPLLGEAELEHVRVSTRSPARVEFGRHPAVQVACGMHHTGMRRI